MGLEHLSNISTFYILIQGDLPSQQVFSGNISHQVLKIFKTVCEWRAKIFPNTSDIGLSHLIQ